MITAESPFRQIIGKPYQFAGQNVGSDPVNWLGKLCLINSELN